LRGFVTHRLAAVQWHDYSTSLGSSSR
jgi:hypothetical protein